MSQHHTRASNNTGRLASRPYTGPPYYTRDVMEPQIQYAKTEDGVNIGFWTLGDGPPLIFTPGAPASPTLRSWQSEEGRRFLEVLAQHRRIIRYDNRGFGNSQRRVAEVSLDAWVADLAAVVDHLSLDRFALCGVSFSVPMAITYAARYPERVSKLITWMASARGADYWNLKRFETARNAAEEDPDFFLEIIAHEAFGWSSGEHAQQWVATMKDEGVGPLMIKSVSALLERDVTHLLSAVTAPTLVLHRRQVPRPPLSAARSLAAEIPNARLLVLEGDSGAIYVGDTEPVLRAIDEFLEGGYVAPLPAPSVTAPPASVVTILFTDLVSSTALTQRLGDAKAQELVRAHNSIVREALAAQGGTEIKHTGDGIMASFPTASGALECAIALQRAVEAQNREPRIQNRETFQVHVGLNAGEPVAEERDLFGTAVQLARRICDHATAGQILTSNVVRELAAGKGFLFADVGEVVPKGFDEPVRLYEVRWQD